MSIAKRKNRKRRASPPPGDSPYRTKQEAAQYLRTSERTLSRRWQEWGLTAFYLAGKWLTTTEELEGLVARRRESGRAS